MAHALTALTNTDAALTNAAPTRTTDKKRSRLRYAAAAGALAAVTTGLGAPLASAAPEHTWTLGHETTEQSIDLSHITDNPEWEDAGVDVDEVLAELAAALEAENTGITLTGQDRDSSISAVEPANAVTVGAGSLSSGISAPQSSSAVTNTANQAVVDAAYSVFGTPYVWGGTTPAGFDCSGLTSWAYAQAGKDIPRTSQAQAQAGQQVSRADMQPGDIIVYYPGATHVGLYVGDGKMVDSLGSGYVVDERPVDYMPIHSIVRF